MCNFLFTTAPVPSRVRRMASAVFGIALGLGLAAATAAALDGARTLDIANRVPKFEKFYADATAKPLDADARWTLWQKEYGIAAVPPGPEGMKMARKFLDAAWDRYPALLPEVTALEKTAEADANDAFAKINALFETGSTPIRSRVVLYVGQFDENAFTIPPMNGQPATVVMPVEIWNPRLVVAHELTHSVNIQLAGVKSGFGGPIGETMFLEGLAMRTTQQVFPGAPEAAYIEVPGASGWLKNCYAKKDAVLAGIVPDLDKSGREITMKYTFGDGNTGMHRELYCAAWIVMGRLLASGKTLPELARIPELQMVETIRTAMAAH